MKAGRFSTAYWLPKQSHYLNNASIEAENINFREGLSRQTVIATDGTDITEEVEAAVKWLTEHSF